MRVVRVAPSVYVAVERGRRADYDHLARFHYRAGPPAVTALVLVARAGSGRPIGVLVASYPTLNGWWRGLAWPARYGRNIARLNREVRVISRVVVDPRWRGLGVASALVRLYLLHYATCKTEAVAAMGDVSPFFVRAGMRELRREPEPQAASLAADLAKEGIRVDRLVERVYADRVASIRSVMRRVRQWARGHASVRRHARARGWTLLAALASRALQGSLAYVAERSDRPHRGKPWERRTSSRRRVRRNTCVQRQTPNYAPGSANAARSRCPRSR